MSNTKRQKQREHWAKTIEQMVGPNRSSEELRTTNRRIDKQKRKQRTQLREKRTYNEH